MTFPMFPSLSYTATDKWCWQKEHKKEAFAMRRPCMPTFDTGPGIKALKMPSEKNSPKGVERLCQLCQSANRLTPAHPYGNIFMKKHEPPCRRIVFEDQKAPCDVGGRWDKAVRYPEALRNNFSPAHCTTPPHCSPAPHKHALYTGCEMLRLGSMAAIDIAQPNGLQRALQGVMALAAWAQGCRFETLGCPTPTIAPVSPRQPLFIVRVL